MLVHWYPCYLSSFLSVFLLVVRLCKCEQEEIERKSKEEEAKRQAKIDRCSQCYWFNDENKTCKAGWKTDIDHCVDATVSKTSITRKKGGRGMKLNEAEILKSLVKSYQDKLDYALEDYSLICAVLGLLKEHGAPEDGDTVRHLQRRQIKIADKMKGIQEGLDTAQKELKVLEEE